LAIITKNDYEQIKERIKEYYLFET
jgi:hypothetical protein